MRSEVPASSVSVHSKKWFLSSSRHKCSQEVPYFLEKIQNIAYGVSLKKNLNASRPSARPPVRGKMSKRLGGIISCKYKTS